MEAVEGLLLQVQVKAGVHHHCVPVPPTNVSISVADPDPYALGPLDPDTDPFVIKQNNKKNLNSYRFVTSF